ncbi:hypothetical protein WA158_000088 [Blastocystis sp. Blastoise]
MVKDISDIDITKIESVQNDVVHFEQLISDLVGILGKSISFCIHSGDSINGLLNHYLGTNEVNEMKNEELSKTIIQEPSFLQESISRECIHEDKDEIDYIRFTNSGVIYSLPKKITNSLVGSYIYAQSDEDQRTTDGCIYLDYPYDESCVPLLLDSLMNKKIDVDSMSLDDQVDLLSLFEYCEVPIPEECSKILIRRDFNMKRFEDNNDVVLYVNFKKNEILRDYFIKKGLWIQLVKNYRYGYVDYYATDNRLSIDMNYKYIDYIQTSLRCNGFIYISESGMDTINKEVLKNEMCAIYGDIGKDYILEGMIPVQTFMGTTILINKMMETYLINWLGIEKKWKLLYRASEHDYSAKEFHKYCDKKGETVTLIKHIGHNDHVNIFGGYTDQNWVSPKTGYYISTSHEFVFTLSNEHFIPPTLYNYTNSNKDYGIDCNATYGPTFGGGFDIYISDNCHINSNSYCSAFSYGTCQTTQKKSLFVNTNNSENDNAFLIEDYEVWGRA